MQRTDSTPRKYPIPCSAVTSRASLPLHPIAMTASASTNRPRASNALRSAARICRFPARSAVAVASALLSSDCDADISVDPINVRRQPAISWGRRPWRVRLHNPDNAGLEPTFCVVGKMRHNTSSLWNEFETIEKKAGVSQITRSRMSSRIQAVSWLLDRKLCCAFSTGQWALRLPVTKPLDST